MQSEDPADKNSSRHTCPFLVSLLNLRHPFLVEQAEFYTFRPLTQGGYSIVQPDLGEPYIIDNRTKQESYWIDPE